jgi:hypothetical protein
MGPNEQYPNYHNNNNNNNQSNSHAQSNYPGYQARPLSTQQVPATQHAQQLARTNSANTTTTSNVQQTYQDYQQPQQTTQAYTEQNNWYGGATGAYGSQVAAETLSRLGSSTEQTRSASVTAAQNHTDSGSTAVGYGQASTNHLHNSDASTILQPSAAAQNQTRQNYAEPAYSLIQQSTTQARPSSVNSVRSTGMAPQPSSPTENINLSGKYARPGAQQLVQMAHSRSASPAQILASRNLQSLQADQRAAAAVAASGPYSPPRNRPVQSSTNVQQTEQHIPLTTIDPSAVYDAWPEHQKRLETIRTAKAIQDTKEAAELKSQDGEAAKVEEEKKTKRQEAEAARKADEEQKAAGAARKKAEAAQRQTEAKATKKAAAMVTLGSITPTGSTSTEAEDAEEQIRQLMAKVRAINDKHPTLLAKFWEQERQQHLEATSQSPQPAGAVSSPRRQQAQSKLAAPPPATPVPPPSGQKQPLTMGDANASANMPVQPVNGADARSKVQGPNKPATKPIKGATFWPDDKKGLLAKTAANILNLMPENQGHNIQPKTISEMLDRNPTFIELCEMLEALGLKVERSLFARGLLSSVPKFNSKQPGTVVPTSRTSSAAPAVSPRIGQNIGLPRSNANNFTQTPPQRLGLGQCSYQPSQNYDSPSIPNIPPNGRPDTGPEYRSAYINGTGQSIPAEVRPPIPATGSPVEKVKKSVVSKASKAAEPRKSTSVEAKAVSAELATKEDAARKRAFADLVDLTLSDDDMPPNKRLYTGSQSTTVPGQAHQPNPNFMPGFDPQSTVSPYLQQGASQWMGQNAPMGQNTPTAKAAPYLPVHRPLLVTERQRNVELAQPLNPKKAKKVLGYDVRTIARDVLLATGKHPDLIPLNGHLEPLKTVYPKQIDHYSDLTTIRWDILDPGEPVYLDSDDRDSVIADGDADDETDNEPIAVRSMIGVGGGSTETMVSAPPRMPIKGTFGVSTPNQHRRRDRPPGSAFTSADGVRQRPFGFGDGETPQPRSGQPYQRGEDEAREQLSSARPVNQTASASGSRIAANSNQQVSTPTSMSASGSGGVGYADLTPVDADGNPIKMKGRPVGWRKNLHQVSVGLLAGGSGDTATGKKKATEVSSPLPPVTYAEYACKWENCQARLHNLPTLKKHINKVHGKSDQKGRFTCKWENCPKMIQVADKETGEVRQMPQYHYFPNQESMLEHVDKAHVGPIAWKLGDGPPDGLLGI